MSFTCPKCQAVLVVSEEKEVEVKETYNVNDIVVCVENGDGEGSPFPSPCQIGDIGRVVSIDSDGDCRVVWSGRRSNLSRYDKGWWQPLKHIKKVNF